MMHTLLNVTLTLYPYLCTMMHSAWLIPESDFTNHKFDNKISDNSSSKLNKGINKIIPSKLMWIKQSIIMSAYD